MTNTFNTDVEIFGNTLRQELPGQVLRVSGSHASVEERRKTQEMNNQMLKEEYKDTEEITESRSVCGVQGVYINPKTDAPHAYNIDIEYHPDNDHMPQGFDVPYIVVIGGSTFTEEDIEHYDKRLADDFKAHWAKTNEKTDAAEAARLCAKNIIDRAGYR